MTDKSIKDKLSAFGARLLNREFLVFLFLFLMTVVFWCVIVFREQYEGDIKVVVKLTGDIPKDVVLLDEPTDTLTINLRESRWDFLQYNSSPPPVVPIPFSKYKQGDEIVVSNIELQKLVRPYLHETAKINSLKRDALVFKFNHGQRRRLPVKFKGYVKTKDRYEVNIQPEYVEVYAQEALLNQLKSVKTEEKGYEVKDTVIDRVKLDLPRGYKCIPSEVQLMIVPVVYIEKTLEVPIECINEPDNKKLRMFPTRVKITFNVEMNLINSIDEHAFRIVADYNSVARKDKDKCKIELMQRPSCVKNVRLDFNETDYLIDEL